MTISCALCGQETETTAHLFRWCGGLEERFLSSCSTTEREIWRQSEWEWRTGLIPLDRTRELGPASQLSFFSFSGMGDWMSGPLSTWLWGCSPSTSFDSILSPVCLSWRKRLLPVCRTAGETGVVAFPVVSQTNNGVIDRLSIPPTPDMFIASLLAGPVIPLRAARRLTPFVVEQ